MWVAEKKAVRRLRAQYNHKETVLGFLDTSLSCPLEPDGLFFWRILNLNTCAIYIINTGLLYQHTPWLIFSQTGFLCWRWQFCGFFIKYSSTRELKAMGLTPAQIAEATGLSPEEIEALWIVYSTHFPCFLNYWKRQYFGWSYFCLRQKYDLGLVRGYGFGSYTAIGRTCFQWGVPKSLHLHLYELNKSVKLYTLYL